MPWTARRHAAIRVEIPPEREGGPVTEKATLRRLAEWVFGGVVLVVDTVFTVIRVVVWRSRWKPALTALRRYNKVVLNPVILKRGGKTVTAVHHVGRTSGRPYVTPVWAERSGQSFFIHLPYGTDVDWCRNVLAGGGCVLEREGVRYDAVAPVIVPAAEAEPHLSSASRRMHRLFGVESYLRLDIAPGVQAD
ncbi:nitroreductase family deazaflavin-dependent oxidoreductase [Rhodococcus aetherivorans]